MIRSALVLAILVLACGSPADPQPDASMRDVEEAAPDVSDANVSDVPSDIGVDAGTPSSCATRDCDEGLECVEVGEQAHCVFAPLRPCSEEDPCTNREGEEITTASDVPTCRTPTTSSHPVFDDGPPLERSDPQGNTRYGCVYVPETEGPLPLLVFLHGGSGSADNVYGATSLRTKADTYELSGDPEKPGFVLLSLQARNVHYPYSSLNDGIHTDSLAWDLSRNDDAENLDAWIDTLVLNGSVDAEAVYLVGWSEGGYFAQLYGFYRRDRIAGVAVYSASNPFVRHYQGSRFVRAPELPSSDLPIFGMSRDCDTVACNATQRRALVLLGGEGLVAETPVEDWISILSDTLGNDNVTWQILDTSGGITNECAPSCRYIDGFTNHLTWPDGVNGAFDRELDMLDFLRAVGVR